MIKRLAFIKLRVLFGLVFIFSGFVKAVDPLGFAYKMQDYLEAMFGIGAFPFAGIALTASIVLSAVEFVIGVNMLLGARLKETTWVAGLMMLFMTPLTLWVALYNPVHDCGCFGDALVISNWATFWKNIVFSLMLLGVFLLRKVHKPFVSNYAQWSITLFAFLFSVGISWYAYQHLPILDFRPYKIGNNIIEGMAIPEGAPVDEFDTKLIYEKDGVQKEFTLENYPEDDTTWVFVDQKSLLIKKGYEPPIHDFSITLPDQGEVTDMVLANPDYTFLLVAYDLPSSNLPKTKELNALYDYCIKNNYAFYCLTASVDEDIAAYKVKTGAKYPIATSDKITLKTIIRSNPGLVLIKNADVLNMWHVNDLPSFDKKLEESDLGVQKPNTDLKNILWSLVIFILPILIIIASDKIISNKRD